MDKLLKRNWMKRNSSMLPENECKSVVESDLYYNSRERL
jgi:hypothetical protein